MKKCLTIVLIFTFHFMTAQKTDAIYVELFGAAGIYSVNYDFRFSKRTNKWGMRLGGSYLPNIDELNYVIIPIQFNYLFGENKNKLEVGAGVTTFLESDNNFNEPQFFPTIACMYRYHSSNFLLRVGLSPIVAIPRDSDYDTFSFYPIFLLVPGVSFGIRL